MKTIQFCTILVVCLFSLLAGTTVSCSSSKKSKKPTSTSRTQKPKTSTPTQNTGDIGQSKPKPEVKPDIPVEKEKGSMIAFIKSNRLMPVLEEAQKANKPVFVDFYASWCGPCKVLEREVFNTQEVSTFVNQHFVSVRISTETEDGKAVAQIYGVDKLPTMLFLDKKGVELDRIVGTTTPGRFIRSGAAALDKQM